MATVTRPDITNEPGMWSSFREGVRASGMPWLFILPSLLVMLVITFYPQAYQIHISFLDLKIENFRDPFSAPFVGLKNYIDVLGEGLNVPNYSFFPILGFNIMWTFVNVFFHVTIGLLVAMALNAKNVIGRRVYRTLFVIPWAMPILISGLIWNNMWQRNDGGINLLADTVNQRFGTGLPTRTDWLGELAPPIDLRGIVPLFIIVGCGLVALLLVRHFWRNGVVNPKTRRMDTGRVVFLGGILVLCALSSAATLLDVLGGSTSTSILIKLFDRAGAPVLAFYAVLATNIWLGWPFMMVVATGALQSIPPDLYEAADVDGANKWNQFLNITLPLIRPAMIPAIMLGTIWTFNQFNVIFFISNGGPRNQTELLVTQAYKLIQQEQLYGAAAAFAFVVFFVLLIITLINNRITRATEAYDE